MGLLSFIVFVLGFIVQLAKKTVGKEGGPQPPAHIYWPAYWPTQGPSFLPGSNSQINIYLAWF